MELSMTKEELEAHNEEIENYFVESAGYGRDKVRNFMDIVNKALEQKGKRITELEKENTGLKDGIALKDEEVGCVETDFNTFKSKAKDLIGLLLSDNRIMKAQFESEEQANIWFEHIHQAEQFLNSEVEK